MDKKDYKPATLVVHQGTDRDPFTGAATVPIYLASTYHHEQGPPGSSTMPAAATRAASRSKMRLPCSKAALTVSLTPPA